MTTKWVKRILIKVSGITRQGESGDYSYEVIPVPANQPATYVSFYDAARYTNWLSTGSTEDGVYSIGPNQSDNVGKFHVIKTNLMKVPMRPSHAEWQRLVCMTLPQIQRYTPSQPRLIPLG